MLPTTLTTRSSTQLLKVEMRLKADQFSGLLWVKISFQNLHDWTDVNILTMNEWVVGRDRSWPKCLLLLRIEGGQLLSLCPSRKRTPVLYNFGRLQRPWENGVCYALILPLHPLEIAWECVTISASQKITFRWFSELKKPWKSILQSHFRNKGFMWHGIASGRLQGPVNRQRT